MDRVRMLHILRNPHGFSVDEVREARVFAADRIEEMEAELRAAAAHHQAHHALEDELAVDAQRWRALLASARVRVLGWAGLPEPGLPSMAEDPRYAHIGLELWTLHEFKDENERGARKVTEYADKMREVLREQQPA